MNDIQTQLCPYCSEEIKFEARKCKHCNEWLDQNEDEDNESWEESLYYIIGNFVFTFFLYAWGGAQGVCIVIKLFWPKTADVLGVEWFVNPFTFIPNFIKSFFS